jgi:maleate isomerase
MLMTSTATREMPRTAMKRILLGMLTPSSNTVLEPVTQAMVSGLPEVSVHFSRFKVTEIALSPSAVAQFDDTEILRAAELLAHACVDVIAWNGTAAGWLGFDSDERLCDRIAAATGIKAATSMLALNEVLARTAVTRLALVSPYLDEVQAKIVANYDSIGVACVAEQHLGIRDNFAFSQVPADCIREMTRNVAAHRPDAIAVVCTNLRSAPEVETLERETGFPIYDSIATVVWKSLLLAGIDTKRITGWGRLFRELG